MNVQIEHLKTGGFNPKRVRGLLYGESGVGKTVFASTWPQPLFIDAEDGMASVTLPVDRVRVTSWEEVFAVVDYLINAEELPYETIVIDSLNEIQHLCMNYIVQAFPQVKRSYQSVPQVADYGKMILDIENMVRVLKSLPMHVLFLAQVQNREFDTDTVSPQLTGKNTAKNICRMMDVVGYIFKTETADDNMSDRAIAFDAANYVTKDRSGLLPPILHISNRDTGYREMARFWDSKSK